MTGSFCVCDQLMCLVRYRAGQPSATVSGLPTMPLSRSAGIVARFLSQAFIHAPHGFLNDTMPGCYRAAQTQAAWNRILSCLDVVLNRWWNRERVIWHLESDTLVHYDFTKNRRWE
jgi:hypothetical protein